MHIGHARYTSTLLNINNQCENDYYQSQIKKKTINNV